MIYAITNFSTIFYIFGLFSQGKRKLSVIKIQIWRVCRLLLCGKREDFFVARGPDLVCIRGLNVRLCPIDLTNHSPFGMPQGLSHDCEDPFRHKVFSNIASY